MRMPSVGSRASRRTTRILQSPSMCVRPPLSPLGPLVLTAAAPSSHFCNLLQSSIRVPFKKLQKLQPSLCTVDPVVGQHSQRSYDEKVSTDWCEPLQNVQANTNRRWFGSVLHPFRHGDKQNCCNVLPFSWRLWHGL